MATVRIQAGVFDRKGKLIQPAEKQDFVKAEDTVIASCIPCQKTELSGKEGDSELNRITAFGTVLFRIRYRAGVIPKQIFEVEGIRYDIKHIAEEGRRQYLALTCQRRD